MPGPPTRPHVPFTPTRARALLARIRDEARLLHRLFVELEYRRPDRACSDAPVDPLYFTMSDRLARGLAKLTSRGVCVADLRHGMIDFPAVLDGRPVMLCWRIGEPDLRFWHEPGHGSERLPLAGGDAPERRVSLC